MSAAYPLPVRDEEMLGKNQKKQSAPCSIKNPEARAQRIFMIGKDGQTRYLIPGPVLLFNVSFL